MSAERRAFGGSAFTAPIPPDPVLDPESPGLVAQLARDGAAYAAIYQYGDPVYEPPADTPRHRVACVKQWGPCPLDGERIPIPVDAQPSPGTDGAMVIIDHEQGRVYDFWRARRTSDGGWVAAWGTWTALDDDGSEGATGAGINVLAGLVRVQEIGTGHIDHALVFGTDSACPWLFRYPAVKTDGRSIRRPCLPHGARVQLDPSIDVDAIPGITAGEKAVAKALQTYGAYSRDNAGAPMAFAFETPRPKQGQDPYPEVGFAWDYYAMPHIPWDRLRVLHQWDGR